MPKFLQLADALADMRRRAPCERPDRRELWHSSATDDQAAAVAHCTTCPARRPCVAYAIAADERFGIWGATTPADRRRRTHNGEVTR